VAVAVRVGFGRISDVLKWGDGRTQGDGQEEEEEGGVLGSANNMEEIDSMSFAIIQRLSPPTDVIWRELGRCRVLPPNEKEEGKKK
jgi:hypothetical protein